MDVIDSLRTGEAAKKPRPQVAKLQEPPTGRALWPTFMRRTLDEEDLRRCQPPSPPRVAKAG
ncbi:hypothetical protein GXW74_04650 [Roseomonas eburnea]|uniref:Uncharacterized protein n=1 Tax=Neoroseomonas eburnea TaxID=1346889 RepID=A0A9X9X7S8_9PROT|nr:hypothetical protein [Neoroseomonas eburnea]MBR0679764.1 hypothetical protein [Neoroseomonas eburnea]